MSTASDPIKSEDFNEVAGALATPVTTTTVAASDPIPTDKYLTQADVAASKTAEVGTPAAATGGAEAEAAASAAPAAGTPAVTPAKGDAAPPEDRWPTILENARKKTRAEVEGEYAWAKELPREDVEATRKWIALGNQNPLLALDQLVQGMIRSQPAQKAQIEHYFKSILQESGPAAAVAAAASVATTTPNEDAEPEPDVPTDTSNGVGVVYSAKRQKEWGAWQARQLRKEFQGILDKDLKPILTEREEKAFQTRVDAYTDRSVSAISSLPGYEENRAAIATAYAAIPLDDQSRTEGEKLRDAYLTVMAGNMSTQATEAADKATKDAIASVHRRAEAGTVSPTAPSASQPFDYKSATWEQALRHEFNSAALGR